MKGLILPGYNRNIFSKIFSLVFTHVVKLNTLSIDSRPPEIYFFHGCPQHFLEENVLFRPKIYNRNDVAQIEIHLPWALGKTICRGLDSHYLDMDGC